MKQFKFISLFLLLPAGVFAQTARETGMAFINKLFQKQYAEAMDFFDESLKSRVNAKVMAQIDSSVLSRFGAYEDTISVHQDDKGEYKTLFYYSKFERDSLDIKVTFNSQNKIVRFFLQPHVNFSKATRDSSYTIKSGSILLPGTLLMPDSIHNKHILAIFIHGSGPEDRDETIFANKPFKDIAEGLQQLGISSYRFDKRTLVAPQLFANDTYTIQDETTDDIENIVHYFRQNDTFRYYKLILIGHSQGGMLLPLLMDSLKDEISGGVMMAGNARPLQDLIIEQYNYIYSLQPSPDLKQAIDTIQKQVDYVNSPQFSLQSPKEKLPLNLPASYWMSMKNYDQLAAAKQVTEPLLIVQGERDYQVTMEDFNLWKQPLQGKPNVKFISYPALNHLFMEGTNKSTPAEYQTVQHVPSFFIQDIAQWMLSIK